MEKPRFVPPALADVRKRLGDISPTFCLAKWHNVTLHLHRGLTHSCHNSFAHTIPLEELSANSAALHNTKQKIEARKQMLAGEKPADCSFCWDMEGLGLESVSERHWKSQSEWAWPFFDEIFKNPLSDKTPPKYLEVSFGRSCNFKCSYCSPYFSSSWVGDLLQGGAYPGREAEAAPEILAEPYSEENNPYVKAFWDWWPELKNSLHTFRITGGEPLLSPNTFRVLEHLRAEPAPGLSLAINSNLGVPQTAVERMIRGASDLVAEKKIQNFKLFTSIDAWGNRAEYIRHGLRVDHFWSNLELVLEKMPTVTINLMTTFNALSVSSYRQFLENVLRLRKKYYVGERTRCPLSVDISYLLNPPFQGANVLTGEYFEMVNDLLSFMRENHAELIEKRWGFYDWEINKLVRLIDWMQIPLHEEVLRKRRVDFYRFFSEHDRRRGTDFQETFPEMNDFWEMCRGLTQSGKREPS